MQTEMLEVFREVARQRSITGAAATLRYTQSAVSRQMAALEAEFGARLFDRLPRGVALTAEGRCLLEHASAVLDRLSSARRDVRAVRDALIGRLRVGAFATADAAVVPRALARFRASHPGVEISLVEGLTSRLLGALLVGDADVVLVNASADRPFADERFRLHHLVDEPLLLAVAAGHPLARPGRVVRLAGVADEAWIAGSARAEDTLLAASARRGFTPRIEFVVQEWTAKFGFVAAGLGVTLVPGLAARTAPAGVVLLPLDPEEVPHRTVMAATLAGRTVPAVVEAFLATLRAAAVSEVTPGDAMLGEAGSHGAALDETTLREDASGEADDA
ncbi:LysR family transcriptional regulator [Dactylosporangium sp. CS-033363]|uniref:LysR family transcriptional regulator n=1 Tax=Dactylosporangium sp. CS-033363 TaxID=3239935 RepID=UPI003D8FE3FF